MITIVLGDPTLKDSSLSQYDNIVILLGYVLIPYGRGRKKREGGGVVRCRGSLQISYPNFHL